MGFRLQFIWQNTDRGGVNVLFNDIQFPNIEQTASNLEATTKVSGFPSNLKANFATENIATLHIPTNIDGALLANFLHFVDIDSTKTFLSNLRAKMSLNGLVYISVTTPFNRACIGSSDQSELYENVVNELARLKNNLPIERFNKTYNRQMWFFTPEAITRLLASHGFEVMHLKEFRNTLFPNGRGEPENLHLVAKAN